MAKPKSAGPKGRKTTPSRAPARTASAASGPLIPWSNNLFFLLLGGAVLSIVVFHLVPLGVLLIVAALVLQVLSLFKGAQLTWLTRWAGRLGPAAGVGLILLLWLAFSAVLLTYPNFNWMFPKAGSFPFQQSVWAQAVLFAGLAAAFYLMPRTPGAPDLASRTAHLWLFAALAMRAFLDLCRVSQPFGSFWDDQTAEFVDVRRIRDLADFQWSFIFFYGKRVPFMNYYELVLWKLLPFLSEMTVIHLASATANLGTVWLLYLTGKELGGRRTGVIAAALAAASKPLLQYMLLDFNIIFIPFSIALALLFTLRLFRKPDLKHFLQWGLALSFGTYCYSSYRPFVPFLVFAVFLWILARKEDRISDRRVSFAVGGTALAVLLFFLYTNHAFPNDNWIARTIDVSGSFLPCLALAALLGAALQTLPKLTGDPRNTRWFGWTAATWLCVLLCYPIMANDLVMQRLNENVLVKGGGILSAEYFLKALQGFRDTLMSLFWQANYICPNNLPQDSFFDLGEDMLIALGLAALLAQPSWKKGILAVAAFLGFAPYALTVDPQYGKLLGCITPFFLLGALGLNRLLEGVLSLPRGRAFQAVLAVLLAGLWAWSADAAFSREYRQYSDTYIDKHVMASRLAFQEQAQGRRVYFGRGLFNWNAYPLNEGDRIHLWSPPNVIAFSPQEKPQDVSVILEPDQRDDKGQSLKDQLTQAFPGAEWAEFRSPDLKPTDPPRMVRCRIPYALIPAYCQGQQVLQAKALRAARYRPAHPPPPLPPPLFDLRTVQDPSWDREFFEGGYGFYFDMIDYEDRAADPHAPVPGYWKDHETVRFTGTIHVDNGGDFKLDWKTANRTQVRVDDRTLLDLYFPQTLNFKSPERDGTASLSLPAGDHRVVVTTWFERNNDLPELSLRRGGAEGQGTSLWSTFKF